MEVRVWAAVEAVSDLFSDGSGGKIELTAEKPGNISQVNPQVAGALEGMMNFFTAAGPHSRLMVSSKAELMCPVSNCPS